MRTTKKPQKSPNPVKAFWSKVDRPGTNVCWPWLGRVNKGEGIAIWEGRRQAVHRIAWQITYGQIPKGPFILHTCGNKLWLNPVHLYPGTRFDVKHTLSDEGRKRLSERQRGRKHTEEAKEKNRKAHLGKKHSEKTKALMRQAHLGKSLSDKARKQMSKAQCARFGVPEDPVERFWYYVDKLADPKMCWQWQGSTQPYGYGQIAWEGKLCGAHRVAYEIAFGQIPQGKCVLHHCDNPSCVNPAHLFLGTRADNVRNMVSKGRQARGNLKSRKGSLNSFAKLTEENAREIRQSAAKGATQESLAKRFSVHPSTINDIISRRTWKHIP